MLQLENKTPFNVQASLTSDVRGVESLLLMVKGTFTLSSNPELATEQAPIHIGDEYWGDPADSSLRYAGEFHLPKPGTDLVLLGHAQTPNRNPVTVLDAQLSVGHLKKTIRVFGDRFWKNSVRSLAITEPEAFEAMPLVYERAFGGSHLVNPDTREILYFERNPVGVGFVGKRSAAELVGAPLPNLENPKQLISKLGDTPEPACFAYVAPTWLPRNSFAGTYDDAWQKKRAPYLPLDFDARFFHAAHPSLISTEYLKGGEPVTMMNLSPDGPRQFCLPRVSFSADVSLRGKVVRPPFAMETVLFEPDEGRFSLVWRALMCCDKRALQIETISFGLKELVLE